MIYEGAGGVGSSFFPPGLAPIGLPGIMGESRRPPHGLEGLAVVLLARS